MVCSLSVLCGLLLSFVVFDVISVLLCDLHVISVVPCGPFWSLTVYDTSAVPWDPLQSRVDPCGISHDVSAVHCDN